MNPPSPIRRRDRLPLTTRQQQVLDVLKNTTLTRKQAAHTLGISLGTLHSHLTGALARLNATSLTHALELAA